MSLTWKDAIATTLVGISALVTFALLKGYDWPIIGSWRMGSLTLFLIGIATCIVAGWGKVPIKNIWTITATAMGVLAIGSAIIGIIIGNKLAFLTLSLIIFLLWVLTTTHHLIEERT